LDDFPSPQYDAKVPPIADELKKGSNISQNTFSAILILQNKKVICLS